MAEVFRNSALFAGVLNTEELFQAEPVRSVSVSASLEASGENGKASEEIAEDWHRIPLMLANGRIAYLRLPPTIEPEDVVALKESFLANYKLFPRYLGTKDDKRSGREKDVATSGTLKFQSPPKKKRI